MRADFRSKNLVIGSEGTLAVITKCILRLLPKPETTCSVLIAYPDLSTGISSVLKVIKANANPTAIEFIERSVVELGEHYTGIRFPSDKGRRLHPAHLRWERKRRLRRVSSVSAASRRRQVPPILSCSIRRS